MKTYIWKLKPTKSQLAAIEQTGEVCRHLYNGALAERKDAWENEKRSVNFAQQCACLPVLKEKSAYLPNIHSQVLQDEMHRVNRSFENFFRRVKTKEAKAGFPRFQGKGWHPSGRWLVRLHCL